MQATSIQTRSGQRKRVERRPVPPGRAAHKHACFTLLWAAASFLALQLGVRWLIDHVYPAWRDPAFETKAGQLQQLLSQSTQPPDLVMMVGSSVTVGAFKARSVEDRLHEEFHRSFVVANMGNHSGGPLTELMWTRRLLARGIRPRLLLIEFSPQFFNDGLPMDLQRFPDYLLAESDLDVIQRYGGDADLRLSWWRNRLVPSYGHRLTMMNALAKPLVPREDQIGAVVDRLEERFWVELDMPTPEERQRRTAVAQAHGVRSFRRGPLSLAAMKELLELAKNEGIPTVVVMVPWGHAARDLFPAAPLEQVVQEVVHLCDKNGSQFVRAREWLDDNLFEDSIHVTSPGAEVFTHRLIDEVILPQLVPHSPAEVPARLTARQR